MNEAPARPDTSCGPMLICPDCGSPIPLRAAEGVVGWKTLCCDVCRLVIHLGRGTVSEHRFR
jgi:hypothetical protein